MKEKMVAIAIAVVLMTSTFLTLPSAVEGQTTPSFASDLNWACGTTTFDNEGYLINAPSMKSIMVNPDLGDTWDITVDDDYYDVQYTQTFSLEHEADTVRLWIGLNPTMGDTKDAEGNFHFYYPWSATGTTWLPPGYHDIISQANLTYMGDQFDTVIYPTLTAYFGEPNERANSYGKIDVLIFNIRDQLFWDPEDADSFIAGYFSSAVSTANEANIIHIDSYEWTWRLGPNPPTGGPAYRPFMYEGVVAHEFQHLIHADVDFDETDWINEGCSDFAGFLCGYGHPQDHITYYLAYHPYTSLTFWGGGLENYGASYLFTLYLSEHYGGADFISDLVANPLNGIEGVEDTLADRGFTEDFDTIFHDWAIANYIDDLSMINGKYGYYSLDIPSADTWGYSIQYVLWNWYIGTELNRNTYLQSSEVYGTIQPYTAQYWEFGITPLGKEVNFMINGDQESGVPAYSGSYEWYSGMGNWAWRTLKQTFTVPPGGATLKFQTYYEIEEDWDYAYVEVHDLDAATEAEAWTTLAGTGTTSTLPYEQDNPTTPDDREPTAYKAAGKWNAFTGFSSGYGEVTMDLSSFAGHDIELYFVYWTDAAYNEQGIYIDDISIAEIGFSDNCETVGDWANDGWIHTTGLQDNNWMGTVIDVIGIKAYRNPSVNINLDSGKMLNFQPGKLVNVWDIAGSSVAVTKKYVNAGHVLVAVFWNAAPHVLRADYGFTVT